jgi:hypothetical protein
MSARSHQGELATKTKSGEILRGDHGCPMSHDPSTITSSATPHPIARAQRQYRIIEIMLWCSIPRYPHCRCRFTYAPGLCSRNQAKSSAAMLGSMSRSTLPSPTRDTAAINPFSLSGPLPLSMTRAVSPFLIQLGMNVATWQSGGSQPGVAHWSYVDLQA